MNIRKLLLISAAILGLAAQAAAQTQATQATVARVTGAATVTNADGSTAPLTVGMKISQGATVTTGADGDVYIESHNGYLTAIKKNSVVALSEISVTSEGGKVKEEKTILDLKSGNLVAKLDPSKKAVNNYQVRTPKGVAAARGTVFTVSYNGGTYALSVVNGIVTILPTSGTGAGVGSSSTNGVQVNAGESSVSLATDAGVGASLPTGQINNAQNATAVDVRELLAVAVATVTIAAQNNIGGTTAAEAAQVAAAVFAVVPAAAEQAGAIIKQSNTANPPADAAAAAAVLQEVTNATPPAAQDAFTSGTSTGTFTPNTNTTTQDAPKSDTGGSNKNEAPPPQISTPQPIDPSTVSRSGE